MIKQAAANNGTSAIAEGAFNQANRGSRPPQGQGGIPASTGYIGSVISSVTGALTSVGNASGPAGDVVGSFFFFYLVVLVPLRQLLAWCRERKQYQKTRGALIILYQTIPTSG